MKTKILPKTRAICFALFIIALIANSPARADSILWYNGDCDFNGVQNGRSTGNPDSSLFDNFIVPAGVSGWSLTSLFSNNLLDTTVTAADWAIRTGAGSGTNGNLSTVLFSGTSAIGGIGASAYVAATGNAAFGYSEYQVLVSGLNIFLAPGTYWLNVTPVGNGTGQSFNSTTNGANAIGLPAGNDSNAFSVVPGGYGIASGPTHHDFSMGVVGTVVPEPSSVVLFVSGFAFCLRRRSLRTHERSA